MKQVKTPYASALAAQTAQTVPSAVAAENYTRDNVEANRSRMEYLAGKSELTEEEKAEAEAAVKSLTKAATAINWKFKRTEEDAKNAIDYINLSDSLEKAISRVPTEEIRKSVSAASTEELEARKKELDKFEIVFDTDRKNALEAEQSAVNKELNERRLQSTVSAVTGSADYAAYYGSGAWEDVYKKAYEDKYRYGEKNKWTYAAWQKSLRPSAWTDEEKSVYNYLYAKYGEKTADGFAEQLEEKLNERTAEMMSGKIAESAVDGAGMGLLAWAGSVGDNLSGIVSLPVEVGEGIVNTIKGNGYQIDQNAPRYAMTRATETIRSSQGEKLAEKYGAGAQFAYDVVSSAVDSTLNAAMGAGIAGAATKGTATAEQVGKITSAIMGSEVAASTVISEMNAGKTAADATMTGIIRGAVEGITEKYSIEAIFKAPSKKAIVNAGRAFLAEGSEEVSSNWLNRIVDVLRDGNEAEIKKTYYAYIESGLSEKDALTAVIVDLLKEDALSFVAGGVSGLGINLVSGASRAQAREARAMSETEQTIDADEAERGDVSSEPVRVGKATVIKKPYTGETPVQQIENRNTVQIGQDSVSNAERRIAEAEGNTEGKSLRTALSKIYKSVFRPIHGVTVNGMTYNGEPYTVEVGSGIPQKLISDPNLSAEKLSVLDKVEQVINESEYVGSGQYRGKGEKEKPGIRYDYFETDVDIGGQNYVVLFDVEVLPSANNYRTHRLINIEMTPNETKLPAPSGRAFLAGSSEGAPSNANVAQTGETVKEQATAERSADEIKTEETKKLMAESAGIDPAELAGFYQEKSRQYRVMMQNATVAGRAIEAEAYGQLSDMLDQMAQTERETGTQNEAVQTGRDEIAEALALDGAFRNENTMSAEAQKGAGYGRADLSDGGLQRGAGESAGEQTGGLEGGAGTSEAKQRHLRFNQVRRAIERENRVRNLPKVSAAALGLQNGSEAETLRVIPVEQYDTELAEIEGRFAENGQRVSFVVGELMKRSGESVNAVILENGDVIIQVNNARWTATQLAEHEEFHAMARMDSAMEAEAEARIREKYTDEEFDRVVGVYMVALRNVYDMSDPERAYEYVRGEILADAYAGMNAFGAGADMFRGEVNETVERRNAAPSTGTRGNTGNGSGGMPGDERYSIAKTREEEENPLRFPTVEEMIERDARKEGKIVPGMSDEERASLIADKVIVPAVYEGKQFTEEEIEKVKNARLKEAKALLFDLARRCGVFHGDYRNADVELTFSFTKDAFKESYNKQIERGQSSEAFGEMLEVLSGLCVRAQEIEAHTDKYAGTRRQDQNLKEVHVLLSALKSGNRITPVQMEIKEFKNKSGGSNKLYVTVTLGTNEKAGVVTPPSNVIADRWLKDAIPANITVSELIRHVKPEEGALLKYIPDSMLDEAQIEGKNKALAKENESLGNMRYEYAVEKGDSETVNRMLRNKAEESGYATDTSWRMRHSAPNASDGLSASIADAEGMNMLFGGRDLIYSARAEHLYGEGRDYDGKTLAVLRRAKSNPDMKVSVFRAVPARVREGRVRNGDWVALTREYAEEHGEREWGEGNFRIIENRVRAGDVYNNADSIHEYGYDNGADDEVYANTENNVKKLSVTYDDNGKLIPYSERFNTETADERYSAQERKEPAEMDTTELRRSVREDKATLEAWDALDERGELSEKMQTARNELRRTLEAERAELREREKQLRERKAEIRERTEKEMRPTRSIAKLKKDMINMFSVPMGSRGEIGSMIDTFADYVRKQGKISNAARNRLFQRLYDAGVVQIEADENAGELRRSVVGSHLYVPDSVKAEFGDDWNSFRGRAFGAGILLTNDKGNRGIDSLYKEMDEAFPGEFTTDETDQTTMLREIVGAAEAGKAQSVSLDEMMRRNRNETGWSVEEQIGVMRDRMDRALDAYAEMAGLETELKARTKNTVDGALAEIREKEQQKRERTQLRELQQKTLKSLQWLKKNQMKAPADLKAQFEEVLGDLDLYAVSAANEMRWSKRHNATWRDLADMYKEAEKKDPNFLPSKELERIVARLDMEKIGDMDVTALEDLYRMAQMLRTEFYNRNNVINDELHRTFQEVFDNSVQEIKASGGKGHLGRSKSGLGHTLTNVEMMTPINILEMMGGWKADGTWFSMGKQLQTGERNAKGYEVGAKAMLKDFIDNHAEWIKRADGQGKDAVWYEIEVPELLELHMGDKPIFGETKKVYMTPAQKVHMALEAENYQNLAHMTGGRTFVNKELYADGKTAEAYAQGTTVRLAPETVKNLVKDLTPEEKALFDALKKYYNVYAAERINAVSNPLYGYDKAVTQNYAPIFSNSNYTKFQAGVFDMTAEGVGHMKGRQQMAKNPSYNISAFDAFTRHIDQTKRFVGYAIPVRNMQTLINWRTADTSLMDEITHVWGKEGLDYVTNIMTELQSPTKRDTSVLQRASEKALSNYITAVFGANPGIVLKQFASYPAASAVLGTRNMPSLRQIRNTDTELIARYTPELEYRQLGYATPEVAELKKNPNWMDTNKTTKFLFRGGAITWMDATTVKCLWPWAENYVRKNYPELERGSDADVESGNSPFYKKVAEVYNDAVNTTQPMYDTMNRPKIMEYKNEMVRAYTLFKTVPLQEYNTLRRYAGELATAGAGPEKKKAIRKFAEACLSVLMSTLMLESIEAANQFVKNGLSAYRDDEDELTVKSFAETFAEKMASDIAGITLVGDDVLELAERIFTDKYVYGDVLEAPGVGQVNEILNDVVDNAQYFGKLAGDVWNVADNGGSVEEYLKRNGGDIVGAIKDFAVELGKYAVGLPVENIEKYLTGIMSMVVPGLRQNYDDMTDTPTKTGLKDVNEKQLPMAIENYFGVRGIGTTETADEELARLYAAGYNKAIPSDTPSDFTVAGESVVMTAYQKQVYDNEYKSAVGNGINEIVEEPAYIEADDEMKAKILDRLYSFAAQSAKLAIREDYDADKWVLKGIDAIERGVPVWAVVELQAQGFGSAKGKTTEHVEDMDLTGRQKEILLSCWLGEDESEEEKMSGTTSMTKKAPATTKKRRSNMDSPLPLPDIEPVTETETWAPLAMPTY